jgi:hypothetical protein
VATAACIFSHLLAASACSSPPIKPQAAQPKVRVLIQFRVPVDAAAPGLVSRLEQLGGLSIHYVAAVSPKLHAYELACPANEQSCDAAIRLLRTDPDIMAISPDLLRKPTNTPR